MSEAVVLYGNAILWLSTLAYWWKKKSNNVGVLVLALYSAIACVSCHLYLYTDFCEELKGVYIFPFIYLFVIITLLIYPLFALDYKKITAIKLPPLKGINIICIYIVLCAIYELIISLPEIQNGLTMMLLDSSNSLEAYSDTTDANLSRQSLSGSINIIGVLVSTGINFSMLFFFIYLLYPKKNKWILFGMIMAIMINPISSLASGSREKVITTLIVFFFMYVLLRPFISKRINKVISYGGAILTVLLLSLFIVISFARARGELDDLFYMLEVYFGMSFLQFDDKCLFIDGTREGNWVSPLINVLLGGKAYSQTALRQKYASLGVDNGTFYTFVGDFVLDYGPLLAFIILLLIAFIFKRGLKVRSTLTASHIVLYYMLLKLLSGFYLHQYPGIGGNLFIFELVLLYMWFMTTRLTIINRKS